MVMLICNNLIAGLQKQIPGVHKMTSLAQMTSSSSENLSQGTHTKSDWGKHSPSSWFLHAHTKVHIQLHVSHTHTHTILNIHTHTLKANLTQNILKVLRYSSLQGAKNISY